MIPRKMPSAPILFTHEGWRWVAQQWPNSEGRPERIWQVKPLFREKGDPILAACEYFERMHA
jgi:hypothetical protein